MKKQIKQCLNAGKRLFYYVNGTEYDDKCPAGQRIDDEFTTNDIGISYTQTDGERPRGFNTSAYDLPFLVERRGCFNYPQIITVNGVDYIPAVREFYNYTYYFNAILIPLDAKERIFAYMAKVISIKGMDKTPEKEFESALYKWATNEIAPKSKHQAAFEGCVEGGLYPGGWFLAQDRSFAVNLDTKEVKIGVGAQSHYMQPAINTAEGVFRFADGCYYPEQCVEAMEYMIKFIVIPAKADAHGLVQDRNFARKAGFAEYWKLIDVYYRGKYIFTATKAACGSSSEHGLSPMSEKGEVYYTFADELRYFDGKESRKIASIGAATLTWMFAKGNTAYFKYDGQLFEATPGGIKEISMIMFHSDETVVTYNIGEKTAFPPLTPEKAEAEKAAEKAAQEAVKQAAAKQAAAKQAAAKEAARRFLRNIPAFIGGTITVTNAVKSHYKGEHDIIDTIQRAIQAGAITHGQIEEAAPESEDDLRSYVEEIESGWYDFEISA